jgi:hypothetical protein
MDYSNYKKYKKYKKMYKAMAGEPLPPHVLEVARKVANRRAHKTEGRVSEDSEEYKQDEAEANQRARVITDVNNRGPPDLGRTKNAKRMELERMESKMLQQYREDAVKKENELYDIKVKKESEKRIKEGRDANRRIHEQIMNEQRERQQHLYPLGDGDRDLHRQRENELIDNYTEVEREGDGRESSPRRVSFNPVEKGLMIEPNTGPSMRINHTTGNTHRKSGTDTVSGIYYSPGKSFQRNTKSFGGANNDSGNTIETHFINIVNSLANNQLDQASNTFNDIDNVDYKRQVLDKLRTRANNTDNSAQLFTRLRDFIITHRVVAAPILGRTYAARGPH